MRLNKKEAGFGAVGVIIVVVVLLAVGFAGWWVWQKQQDKDKKADATSQTANDQETNNAANEQRTPAAVSPYLTVVDWGVRVKLSDKIADATYMAAEGNANAKYAYTEAFKSANCPLASLYRFTADHQEPYADQKDIDRYPDAVKVGDYYYTVVRPQAPCGNDEMAQQKAAAATNAFVEAGKTFEAAP